MLQPREVSEVIELGLFDDLAPVDEDSTHSLEAVAMMDDDSSLPFDP